MMTMQTCGRCGACFFDGVWHPSNGKPNDNYTLAKRVCLLPQVNGEGCANPSLEDARQNPEKGQGWDDFLGDINRVMSNVQQENP